MNHTEEALKLVRDFATNTANKGQYPTGLNFDVVVISSCYTLGNEKYFITTSLADSRYFEVTYNHTNQKFYLDVYSRIYNSCTKVGDV